MRVIAHTGHGEPNITGGAINETGTTGVRVGTCSRRSSAGNGVVNDACTRTSHNRCDRCRSRAGVVRRRWSNCVLYGEGEIGGRRYTRIVIHDDVVLDVSQCQVGDVQSAATGSDCITNQVGCSGTSQINEDARVRVGIGVEERQVETTGSRRCEGENVILTAKVSRRRNNSRGVDVITKAVIVHGPTQGGSVITAIRGIPAGDIVCVETIGAGWEKGKIKIA